MVMLVGASCVQRRAVRTAVPQTASRECRCRPAGLLLLANGTYPLLFEERVVPGHTRPVIGALHVHHGGDAPIIRGVVAAAPSTGGGRRREYLVAEMKRSYWRQILFFVCAKRCKKLHSIAKRKNNGRKNRLEWKMKRKENSCIVFSWCYLFLVLCLTQRRYLAPKAMFER